MCDRKTESGNWAEQEEGWKAYKQGAIASNILIFPLNIIPYFVSVIPFWSATEMIHLHL